MNSSLADRVQRGWAIGRLDVARLSVFDLVPFLVAAAVFKLAISDGGRDPLSLTMAQVCSYAALAVLIWTGRHHLGNVGRVMLPMLGVIVLASVISVRPEASVREFLLWTMYAAVFVVTASTLDGPVAARRMLDLLVAIGGWVVLIGLFIFWGANNPGMRWYSTFYWPNPFAAFLLLVLPLEIVRLAWARAPRETLAHTVLTVLLATAVVLTYSRGAWLSLLLIAPIAVAFLRPPSWAGAAGRLLIVALLVSGAVMTLTRAPASGGAGQGVAARAASIAHADDLSIQGRINFWRAAMEIVRDHPVLGTGPGTFGAVHPRYQRDVRFYARDAHNVYIQTLAEMGIPGGVVLGLLVLAVVRMWRRALESNVGRESYALVLGAGLGVFAFLVHSAMDMDWAFYANPVMAFALIGVIASFDRTSVDKARARASPFRPLAVIALATAAVTTLMMHSAHGAYRAGHEHARAGRYGAAFQQYAAASIRNPLSARYPAAAGYAASRFPDRYQLAEFYIRRAIALDRMNASHPIQLANLLLSRSGNDPARLTEAEHWLTVAIEADPLNRPESYRLLAKTLARQERWSYADQVYRRALQLYLDRDLDRDMIHLLLWPQVVGLAIDAADFFMQMGDPPRAIQTLHDVLAEDPVAIPAALRLSEIYVKAGRKTEARAVLAQVAERVPSNAEIRAALERLR